MAWSQAGGAGPLFQGIRDLKQSFLRAVTAPQFRAIPTLCCLSGVPQAGVTLDSVRGWGGSDSSPCAHTQKHGGGVTGNVLRVIGGNNGHVKWCPPETGSWGTGAQHGQVEKKRQFLSCGL